jgi:hypothetical protein
MYYAEGYKMEIKISMNVEDLMSGFAYTHDFNIFTAYSVYRNTFQKRKDELKCSGVYFLICSHGDDEKLHIYIGQSGNVVKRLGDHYSKPPSGLQKESLEWGKAICFIKPGLSSSVLLSLEKQLFELFKNELSSRFVVHTEKVSSKKIKDENELAKAVEEIRIYLAAMGINTYVKSNVDGGDKLYFCKIPKLDKKATGYRSAEKFIIKKDSYVSLEKKKNFKPDSYWKLRQELEDRGDIKNGRFVSDHEFRSPSEAAAVVRGCSSNGNDVWRICVDGKEIKMKEFLNQK